MQAPPAPAPVAADASGAPCGVPAHLAPLIAAAARAHAVDPALLAAVARTESGFEPATVSPAGARGLMGLMPVTALALGVADPLDPAQSLDAGARHLRRQIDAFDGDLALALAAYRCGPVAVRRHGGVPAYSAVRAYVRRVLGALDELRAAPFGGAWTGAGDLPDPGVTTDTEGRCG